MSRPARTECKPPSGQGYAEAPGPLLWLLGAPDGLAGDAEGPRHCGLGLPVAAQQPDGSGLIDYSSACAAQAITRGQRSDQESPGLA